MQDHVEYNEEVLENLRDKEHVVYVAEIFLKAKDTYIIQEQHSVRLSHHIHSTGPLSPTETELILVDVFQGICDIYEEQYVHRNLRSQHIVRVEGQGEEPATWKIETLVLDNQEFPIQTPFTWWRETASPEDKAQREQLPEDQLDAQIVWNFGYLAMEMLFGTFYMSKLERESEVSWARVKELTAESPALFELVNGCFRHKYKDRISLSKFF